MRRLRQAQPAGVRLPRLGDDAVSLGEVSRQRVIEPRDGLVKSQFGLGELAGALCRVLCDSGASAESVESAGGHK
ncbi:MAG: hypothetical protein GX577_01305 [Leptolinea sp.]|nr:hypothetical protein [Leptolinea sp.]